MSELSTASGERLPPQAREVIPGGVTSSARRMLPTIVFRKGHGAYLEDADGKSYLDFHDAFGAVLLGHNHPAVNSRVAKALEHAPLAGAGVTELELEVASRIHHHVPCAERVLLCLSGSEAVFYAVRVARAFTGRPKILKFQGCYHGTYDSVLINGLSGRDGGGQPEPNSAGILPAVLENTIVCTYNRLDEVERAISTHRGAVAAIIVEPIAHNIGCVMPAPAFLPGLRELATRAGALLIFDEVITGFRHHLGGYQAICGVRPDLATFGKAIANGYPMAAVCGRAEVMERFNTRAGGDTYFAGTFHGHPAGCAAALATLDVLEREPVHAHIFALGEKLRTGLAAVHARLGTGATVAGFGSIFVTYFRRGLAENYTDAIASDVALFLDYRRRLIERGIFLMPSNLKRGHIGYSHTEADIDRFLQSAEGVLDGIYSSRRSAG
jgi:glutamate-1-semialdehyde 2,1-aminomutase